jgi:hypothetical protein
MRIWFFIATFTGLFLSLNLAAKMPEAIPLQFQADKNNIQILPQRFEYNLVDEDHIKIGDIVIDPTTFGFQVAPATEPGKYKARFIWPAGLVKEGVLTIKDNTGKSIWSMTVNRKNTRAISPTDTKSQGGLVRNQLTEFATDQISESLIEDMKYFPYMNFCINRTTPNTNIYLCSKELFLSTQQGMLAVRARSQGKRTAFVEINGKSVGNQGIIFLNDETENIGFRAMTQSGAILEVETRMKPVDFKDVVLSPDQKSLILTASGAEPVNEDKVKKISDEEWQYQIDAQRPILYLKGAGEIPMRQEFYVKGETPRETLRPFVDKDSFRRVYQSQLVLNVQSAPGTQISPGAKNQRFEKIDAGHGRWVVTDIPLGQTSRHALRVSEGPNSFMATYDVYRDYAFEGGANINYWLPAGQVYGGVFFNWWIENFFGSEQSWSRLHWGLNAAESLVLTKKDTEANLTVTHFELLWRAQPGFHFVDPTWGLTLPLEIIQAPSVSTSSPGLGVFYSDRGPKNLQSWLHWYDVHFNYLIGGSGTVQLQNALQMSALGYYHFDKRLSWNYGLGMNQYNFSPGTNKMQLQVLGGASYRF